MWLDTAGLLIVGLRTLWGAGIGLVRAVTVLLVVIMATRAHSALAPRWARSSQPFFTNLCRFQGCSRVGPTLYVRARTIKVAQQCQRLHPEDAPIRVVVESTIESLKRGFPNNKLPVRGLTGACTILLGAATMVDVRRLDQYFRERAQRGFRQLAFSMSSAKKDICHCLGGIWRHSLRLAQPVVSSPV